MPTQSGLKVGKEKRITAEEEHNLLLLWCKSRDKSAKNTLMVHSMGLVCSIARRHRCDSALFDMEDLISVGFFGLEHALRNFDIEQDVKLYTYAAHWINNYIRRFIGQNISTLEVPIKFGYDAIFSPHDHYSKEDMAAIHSHDSLNEKVNSNYDDGEMTEVIETIANPDESPEDIAIKNIEKQWLYDHLDKLNDDEHMFIQRHVINEEAIQSITDITGISRFKLKSLSLSSHERLMEWKRELEE
jgi:RNA polymerase sigma factor (sigma-70 family)